MFKPCGVRISSCGRQADEAATVDIKSGPVDSEQGEKTVKMTLDNWQEYYECKNAAGAEELC